MSNPDAIWRMYPEGPVTENTILLYNGDWDILGDADRDLSPELVNFATMVLQDDEPIASVRSTFKIASSVLTPFMPIDEAGAMRWYTRRELFGNRIWIVPVHLELANRWALFLITGLDVCRVTRCINVYVLGAVEGDKVEVQGVYRTLKTFLGMVHAQEPNQVAWSDIEFVRMRCWDRSDTEPSADSGCRMLHDMQAVLYSYAKSTTARFHRGSNCLEDALATHRQVTHDTANAMRTKMRERATEIRVPSTTELGLSKPT